MSSKPDDEWLEYEVMGELVRIKKKDLDANLDAMRKDPLKSFAGTPGVTFEPAEPDEVSPSRIISEPALNRAFSAQEEAERALSSKLEPLGAPPAPRPVAGAPPVNSAVDLSDARSGEVTYASLDRARGIVSDPTASGLHEWYASIEHQPVETLNDDDLSRALRQQVHLEVTLPAALTMLERNLWAGSLFPGALAHGLERVPAHLWRLHPGLRARAAALISRLMTEAPPDDLYVTMLEELRRVLTVASKTIAEASAKRVFVQIGDGPRVVQEDEDQLVIGSGPKASVLAKELAGEHAWVRRGAHGWEVCAIGGEVVLNGRHVTVAPLKPGDVLELGPLTAHFGEVE